MFPNLGRQYHFIKQIGDGGSSIVNLAIDTHTGYPVAIKSLFDTIVTTHPVMLERLKKELQIYLMLNHKSIVKPKDLIIKNNTAHLVMEYVEGKELGTYINTVTGPMPKQHAISIFTEIVSAIGYAHDKKISLPGFDGVLHLDIKPSNVLIVNSQDVKIIDYGISKGTQEKRAKQAEGTPMYMAPEQFDVEKNLDKRTDIYALGTLFFQMVTGKTPYSTTLSRSAVRSHIEKDPLPRLNTLYAGADVKFQEIIDKCTQKRPNDRYQSCNEILSDLNNI